VRPRDFLIGHWLDTQRDDEDYVFGREADKAFWPNTVRKRT
jgi:hypothetical protein